jgi:hypothetical protein
MSERIRLVSGDNRPFVRVTLTDKDGAPINLSDGDTVVRIHFRAVGTTNVLFTLVCAKPNGGADGVINFSFPEGALDIPAGMYEGEVEIAFGTERQTVYQPIKFVLREQFA